MSNDVVEIFHRCLKQMLSKGTEFPKCLDLALSAALLAYNVCPHSSTGLSSHEILFRSTLKGLLPLLRNTSVRPDIKQNQTYNSYLSQLRQSIIKGCQLARDTLTEAGEIQRQYCNRGRKLRTLKRNEEVLIMLPDKTDTLVTSWQGSFTEVKQTSPVNYLVDVRGSSTSIC